MEYHTTASHCILRTLNIILMVEDVPTGWSVIYIEYFGLHGNQDYDIKTMAKLALARAEGINILPIYPTDMINLDLVLKDLIA